MCRQLESFCESSLEFSVFQIFVIQHYGFFVKILCSTSEDSVYATLPTFVKGEMLS